MEIQIIGFTSDLVFDYFCSIFVYMTAIIVPFVAVLSLLKH